MSLATLQIATVENSRARRVGPRRCVAGWLSVVWVCVVWPRNCCCGGRLLRHMAMPGPFRAGCACLQSRAMPPAAASPTGVRKRNEKRGGAAGRGRGVGQLELICAQHEFLSKPGCILFYRHSQVERGRGRGGAGRGGKAGRRRSYGGACFVRHACSQTLMVRWFIIIPMPGSPVRQRRRGGRQCVQWGKGGGGRDCTLGPDAEWHGDQRERCVRHVAVPVRVRGER